MKAWGVKKWIYWNNCETVCVLVFYIVVGSEGFNYKKTRESTNCINMLGAEILILLWAFEF